MSSASDQNVKCGIMSIRIDANSRAPVHCRSSPSKDHGNKNTHNYTRSCSGSSSPKSHISFIDMGEDGAPLSRCSQRGTAHRRAVADESKIWGEAKGSKRRRLSNGVRTTIGKARTVIAKEMDERREIRNLLQRCRNDSLPSKVLHIDGAPCKRQRSP